MTVPHHHKSHKRAALRAKAQGRRAYVRSVVDAAYAMNGWVAAQALVNELGVSVRCPGCRDRMAAPWRAAPCDCGGSLRIYPHAAPNTRH